MLTFLIVALVLVGATSLINVLMAFSATEKEAQGLGVIIINMPAMVMAILAISFALAKAEF